MTSYDHQDIPASEEYTHCFPTGSLLFRHPSSVEHWNQAVPFGEVSFPTPPDSISECASLDSQDMSGQWSQTSLPEAWAIASAQESTIWPSHGAPITVQDVEALDIDAMRNAPSTSVDNAGLSPVLSHPSQSSHTLNSLSEPDCCILPSGLDLSFTAEPSWNSTGPLVYSSSDVTSQAPSGHCFAPSHDQAGFSMGCDQLTPALYPGSQPPVFYSHDGEIPYQSRTVPYPHILPRRPLLPRTEGPTAPSQLSCRPQRTTRPHMQGSHSPQHMIASVSSASGQSQDGTQYALAPSGNGTVASQQLQNLPFGSPVEIQPVPVAHPALVSYNNRPIGSMPWVSDPTEDDFSTYIHFDQEEHSMATGAFSCVPGYGMQPILPSNTFEDVKPVLSMPEQDNKSAHQGSSSDKDECRYRTHHLYSEGPRPDGLYHCPFKLKDSACPHKPTKLKCNYDKFIDSHLKPFRCKDDRCIKQEFSSTACLLRHEREAHGLHGHGDRPHTCWYSGCERGIAGNGFPRRYNLFDHMKRVHDHKEDLESSTASPVVGSDGQVQRKSTGRKRKASATPPTQPIPQRQKATPLPPQPAQVPYNNVPVYFPQSVYDMEPIRRDQHRQRVLYSQWANQRELLAKQMGFLQGPDDEASLQSLSQNIEEFRRLSAEARRR